MAANKVSTKRVPAKDDPDYVPYDTSTLSFGLSGSSPMRVRLIRAIEWVTGKITIVRIANRFEKSGRVFETTFWDKILELLEIDLQYDPQEIKNIPATGPVVVVANHPYGFVDGLALTVLVSRVRSDLKILTRAFFATLPEIEDNMVPVAFPHDVDSAQHNIAVRKEIMDHLGAGGIVILFPSGRSMTRPKMFGKVIEHDWNPFTAKMILKSKARVVPVYFPGHNSWLFQTAQLFSITLRQSLMIHEIWRMIGKTIRPTIGRPIEREEIDPWVLKPRDFMEYLKNWTLGLSEPGAGDRTFEPPPGTAPKVDKPAAKEPAKKAG